MSLSQVAVSSQTTSDVIPINYRALNNGFSPATVQLEISGTASASVQYTIDDFEDGSAVWTDFVDASGSNANALVKLDHPVTGVRLNCTAYTDGDVILKVLQV